MRFDFSASLEQVAAYFREQGLDFYLPVQVAVIMEPSFYANPRYRITLRDSQTKFLCGMVQPGAVEFTSFRETYEAIRHDVVSQIPRPCANLPTHFPVWIVVTRSTASLQFCKEDSPEMLCKLHLRNGWFRRKVTSAGPRPKPQPQPEAVPA